MPDLHSRNKLRKSCLSEQEPGIKIVITADNSQLKFSFKSYVNTTKNDYLCSKLTWRELCLLSVMWTSLTSACVPSIIIISVQDQDAFSGAVMKHPVMSQKIDSSYNEINLEVSNAKSASTKELRSILLIKSWGSVGNRTNELLINGPHSSSERLHICPFNIVRISSNSS